MKRILKDCLRDSLVPNIDQYNAVSACTHVLHIKSTTNVDVKLAFCMICKHFTSEWHTLVCVQQLKSIKVVYDYECVNNLFLSSNVIKMQQYCNLLYLPKLKYVYMANGNYNSPILLLCRKLFKKRLLKIYRPAYLFNIDKLIFVL